MYLPKILKWKKLRNKIHTVYVIDSIRVDLICCVIADGCPSFNLNTDSMTEISVEVVSCPQKAVQSLTTIPRIKKGIVDNHSQNILKIKCHFTKVYSNKGRELQNFPVIQL